MTGPKELAFGVRVFREAGRVVVQILGEVGMTRAKTVAEAFAQALAEGSPVVVDCCGIAFFDSSGLHAFLEARGLAESYRTTAGVPLTDAQ